MIHNNHQKLFKLVPFPFRLILYVVVVLLISNINPVVDMFQHPDIPYFDEEHLIVGFVSSITVIILLVILEFYFRILTKALSKIRMLELYLPICANCKKIRIPGSDPQKKESWKQIESYITEKTLTKFSHGICPDCCDKLYPEQKNTKYYPTQS